MSIKNKKKKEDKSSSEDDVIKVKVKMKPKTSDAKTGTDGNTRRPYKTGSRKKRSGAGRVDWKPIFLRRLVTTGNVHKSASLAGVHRVTVYSARKVDKKFAKDWDDAMDDAVDSLEDVAWKRAKKKSDTLMVFLLKAHRPALYRERSNSEIDQNTGAITYEDIGSAEKARTFLLGVVAALRGSLEAQRSGDGKDLQRINGEIVPSSVEPTPRTTDTSI